MPSTLVLNAKLDAVRIFDASDLHEGHGQFPDFDLGLIFSKERPHEAQLYL
jgi:hypothetical protein